MSCLRLVTILLALLFAMAVPAVAEIIGSPHDLYSQGYLRQTGDIPLGFPQCRDCHISSSDDRPQLWQRPPVSMEKMGKSGILCASCHDGISMVEENVDSACTVFHPQSHGQNAETAPTGTSLRNTGLPYLFGSSLTCTICHDPHAETYRPFLRVQINDLCGRCHTGRRHLGYGVDNEDGNHPVSIDPYDNEGGASPIEVQPEFAKPFPRDYPPRDGANAGGVHWTIGGHLSYGSQGKVECTTCHALHGREGRGPVEGLLARDPVREESDEFCEGCHRGERGDGGDQPPFPNPGGTVTGRTYHPADDDEANGAGWIAAIADTEELTGYVWGRTDDDTGLPHLLCTTCHRAHGGMQDSPCLVPIDQELRAREDIHTFCEVCHRQPPEGHHGYSEGSSGEIVTYPLISSPDLGHTYGSPEPGVVYCSNCHRAHNAGYNRREEDFTPILENRDAGLCESCHQQGVSHFMGDPTLPSTYDDQNPPLRREPWPYTVQSSYYEGEGASPSGITCTSCHDLSGSYEESFEYRLLAPAGEDESWDEGHPEENLCTGCHGEAPATVGEGRTHPLMQADSRMYPVILDRHLLPGETAATYSRDGAVNCHSCHRAHGAVEAGGVYILKVCRGNNQDPKAIHPQVNYTPLCNSCHPK